MKGRVVGILLVTAAAAVAAVLAASGPDPDAVPSADEVAERVSSPYCPGLLLIDCPTPEGAALRADIASQVAAGSTNRKIDAWLVENFGEAILGRPRGALAWGVPFVVLVAGALFIFLSWRKPVEEATLGPSDSARTRIKDELEQLSAESNE